MTSRPQRQRNDRSFASRTSLITAAAIAGVLLAGSAAIAANIGILNAADDSTVGELAATNDLVQTTPPSSAVPTTSVRQESTTTSTTVNESSGLRSEYAVDDAGTVVLVAESGRLDLEGTKPAVGWTAGVAQGEPSSLTVTFTNGVRTVVLTASLAPDGSIVADVNEPIDVVAPAAQPPAARAPTAAPAPPPLAQIPPSGSYDHEDDHDDHEDDHDEYEEPEYEGRDDDD
jgi:hypothetical protein